MLWSNECKVQGKMSSHILKKSPIALTTLEMGTVYTECVASEFKRIVYTRFRLSAHNLKVETGRWARLPREERVCD